jgi:phytoene dehydrogenase-like protein
MYVLPPPDIEAASIAEMTSLVALGRKFRALGRADMAELLRVLPMPVQDLVDDDLELEPLKAGIAAGGIRDLRQGPRSGGTSFVLIHHLVGAQHGSARARPWWRDAPDALATAAATAALEAGVTIRCRATVGAIAVRDDAVAGVALETGDEIAAPIVISTADPARTIGMVDPVWLDPDFLLAVRNIRYRGCTAVIQYALDALPELPGVRGSAEILGGIMSLTPELDAIERAADAAKYGGISAHPHVEVTVPSLRWPTLAPAGKHVLVARAQYAPWRLRDDTGWDDSRRRALGDAVTAVITEAVSGFGDRVLHRQVLAPPDIEQEFALTEGAPTHGELALDQILFMRPVPGCGRHAMPVDGLYLGGAGAHPGPGVLGGAGWLAARRALRDKRRS